MFLTWACVYIYFQPGKMWDKMSFVMNFSCEKYWLSPNVWNSCCVITERRKSLDTWEFLTIFHVVCVACCLCGVLSTLCSRFRVKAVDVMEVTPEADDAKSVYLLSHVKWGVNSDIDKRKSKYWYYPGPLKQYYCYLKRVGSKRTQLPLVRHHSCVTVYYLLSGVVWWVAASRERLCRGEPTLRRLLEVSVTLPYGWRHPALST